MRTKIILTFVALIAVIIGGASLFLTGAFARGEKAVSWYAVHLNNGATYFGHISRISRDRITLNETHYIEKFDAGDNTISQSESFSVQQAPKQIYQLIKRGDEKTLTTDHTLYINRSAVLFWEKLSTDSGVVSSINASRK